MTKSHTNIAIVGASHAGVQTAANLLRQGYSGSISLFSEEAHLPYHRPPLSKDLLKGAKSIDQVQIKPESFFDHEQIDLQLSTRVKKASGSQLVYQGHGDEKVLSYDKIVLATGASPRKLPQLPDDHRIQYVRTYHDIEKIKKLCEPGKQAVLVGGGYIGLETAASLRSLGMKVTLLEALPRLLSRVASPEIGNYFHELHLKNNVDIRLDAQLKDIEIEERLELSLADGDRLQADLVIVGIGVLPTTELAEQLGCEIDNGVVIDEYLATSVPNTFAIGDCSNFYHPMYDTNLRLESVPNTTCQATRLAKHFLDPNAEPDFPSLPWFWSDQFDAKLQIAGLSTGYEDVITHKWDDGSFACAYLIGDKVLAVDCVNQPKVFAQCRRILADDMTVDELPWLS